MDRSSFTPFDSVKYIWTDLDLSAAALSSIDLSVDVKCHPSSFKVDHLAQSTIALSALAAAQFRSLRHQSSIPKVTVPAEHACAEFKSERLYVLNGKPAPSTWGTIGGLHKTLDGYVRMHDSFPNHRENALKILGLNTKASREDVGREMLKWQSIDLETAAFENGAVIAAARSFDEWDVLPQAKTISDFPILLNRISDSQSNGGADAPRESREKCLHGIRVVEMSRVVAAPVAGKTLAAHGADVIWITSPTLPDLPDLDIDFSRGKRTVQLDIKDTKQKSKLLDLLRTADVFIQSYRPGSLAAQGLSTEELVRANPNLIVASLNAYGHEGPWSEKRGFDSLVQTCSGINVADAEHYGGKEHVRVLPCQALDHGAGYLLATGIIATLYRRDSGKGIFEVKVSLAGVMKYLRSLGQLEGQTGFDRKGFNSPADAEKYLEVRKTGFGGLRAVRHSASIENVPVGWEVMPKPLGSDEPVWL